MTKVNYFQVSGNRNGQDVQVVKYARSKGEAAELAVMEGVETGDIKTDVTELNFKAELQKKYTPKELYDIRIECKNLWKDMKKTKEVKAKNRKAKEE